MNKKNKRAQEEMVGFVIIVIIVAIILLFFLNFYLKSEKTESVESYEVNNFIQASLDYTTECRDYFEYLSIKKLISECYNDASCLDGQKACELLNSTLENIIRESWSIGEDRPVKGYEFRIVIDQKDPNPKKLLSFTEGNITKNYKGNKIDFSQSGNSIEVFFRAYY